MQLVWSWLATALEWYTPDKVIALAAVVNAIITTIMFCAIYSQARTAQFQASISKVSAVAAKKAAEIAGQALKMTEDSNKLTRKFIITSNAAFFSMVPQQIGFTPRTVRVEFRNQGKVIASDFTGELQVGTITTIDGSFQITESLKFGGVGTAVWIFPYYQWVEMILSPWSQDPPPPYGGAVLPALKATISFDNGFGETIDQSFYIFHWNGNWIEYSGFDALMNSKRYTRADPRNEG